MRFVKVLGVCMMLSFSATGSAKQSPEAAVAKELEGLEPGEPMNCIDLRRAPGTKLIGISTVIFKVRGGEKYRNDPPGGCPAARLGMTIVTNPDNRKLCSGDVIGIVDLESGIQGGACRLGAFVLYRRPAK